MYFLVADGVGKRVDDSDRMNSVSTKIGLKCSSDKTQQQRGTSSTAALLELTDTQ